jgi:myosin heavy subunit
MLQEFVRTQQSMNQMRLEPEVQAQVWEILAAVLHIGNLRMLTYADVC